MPISSSVQASISAESSAFFIFSSIEVIGVVGVGVGVLVFEVIDKFGSELAGGLAITILARVADG